MVKFFFDSQRQRYPLRRGEMAEERPIAWLVILDSIEDERRRVGRVLAIEDVNNGAHL